MAKILLVENMKGVRRALAARLKEAGHDVSEAEDGGDAIELIKQINFDLAITEMLLSDIDGADIIQFIETQPVKPPIIAMTGGNSQIPAEMALLPAKLVTQATLVKPINEDELLSSVNKLLAKT